MTLTTYSPLGHSGLKVSPLWLGTMMFGDQTADADAASIVDATRDAGINAIDTADVYAQGASERIVGRLIHKDRERWVLATKLANPVGDDPNDRGLSRRWMLKAVEASLRRLDTEWIDLYYMHKDDESTPVEETLSTMARLIETGKIRYYGLSNFRGWRIARLVETARRMGVPPPIACQPPYSLVTRGIETEVIPACAHYGLGVVAYSPLARGVLSAKYRPDAPLPEGSRAARSDKRLLQTELRPESVALSQHLAQRAASLGVKPSEFAIAWALANRHVSGVIGGPRTLAQWQDYLSALKLTITAEDERWVDGLVPPGHASSFGYTDPMYPVQGRQPRCGA